MYNHDLNALSIKATRSGGPVRCRRSHFLMGITESLDDVSRGTNYSSRASGLCVTASHSETLAATATSQEKYPD